MLEDGPENDKVPLPPVASSHSAEAMSSDRWTVRWRRGIALVRYWALEDSPRCGPFPRPTVTIATHHIACGGEVCAARCRADGRQFAAKIVPLKALTENEQHVLATEA
jgi:hypothetical protein